MSLRKKSAERCLRCLMRFECCICSEIPTLDLATRVLVVVTRRELKTPTNTGRLASQALINSVILTTGERDQPFDLREHLQASATTLVLYPSEEATVLTEEFRKSLPGPVNLIVPDGNWRQTSKMRRRVPHMISFPVVKVALGDPTAYRVRKESKPEGLATIEAIARALGVLEGEAVQRELEALLERMTRHTLSSRGVIL